MGHRAVDLRGVNMIQSSFTGVCPAKQLLPECQPTDGAGEASHAG
jgi:hypothetical protein